MKLNSLFLVLLGTSLYSCGQTQSPNDLAKSAGALPIGAIIAVKDDASGETSGVTNDDLRTISSSDMQASADKLQGQELPILYEKAQKSEPIMTQQQEVVYDVDMRGWFHYRRCPGQLVRVIEVNQQEPIILDSCQAYHLYQPVYILRGRAHRFFFHRAHKVRNVTYYYYVNQVSEQQIEEQNAKQTQTTEQKQKPEEQQSEKQIEQQNEQKIECQKQVPSQKTQPLKTKSSC